MDILTNLGVKRKRPVLVSETVRLLDLDTFNRIKESWGNPLDPEKMRRLKMRMVVREAINNKLVDVEEFIDNKVDADLNNQGK